MRGGTGNPEIETVIVLNDADMAEGYFRFGTSDQKVAQRLIRRVWDREIPDVKESKDSRTGKTSYWQFKVPITCISLATFAIGKKKTIVLSEEEKARRRELITRVTANKKPLPSDQLGRGET